MVLEPLENNSMYVFSQVLVFIADAFFIASMFSKKKTWLVVLLFASDILFASHYLCLGGATGAITIYVDAVYLVVMFLLEKFNKTKYNLIPTITTMIIMIVSCSLTWQGPISLLPMFSMLIYLTGMIFTNLVFVKSGAMIRNLLNACYMFSIASYIGASLELCLMISALVGIVLTIKKNKERNANVEISNK